MKLFLLTSLPGGNQRELARAKNLKKQQEQAKKKGGESGVALKERKERCAKFYQESQEEISGLTEDMNFENTQPNDFLKLQYEHSGHLLEKNNLERIRKILK